MGGYCAQASMAKLKCLLQKILVAQLNCEFLSTQLKEYKVPVYIKLIILSSH